MAKPSASLQSAVAAASAACTSSWQADLKNLFDHAKDRFPDVVWELLSEDATPEEVWGHKGLFNIAYHSPFVASVILP
jgi:hypothetical protein